MERTEPLLLKPEDISRVIEMAWEDRTPFEAIEAQFGLPEAGVIRLMRATLKAASFRLWRARVHGRASKHRKIRSPAIDRHRANHRI
jgi:uncharacterized protein (TIGR03643 family)